MQDLKLVYPEAPRVDQLGSQILKEKAMVQGEDNELQIGVRILALLLRYHKQLVLHP